jgi:hypothetical protein
MALADGSTGPSVHVYRPVRIPVHHVAEHISGEVGIGAAYQHVITRSADQPIRMATERRPPEVTAAAQSVPAPSAVQLVHPRSAADPIRAATTQDPVGSAAADDHVVPGRATQDVVAVGPDKGRRSAETMRRRRSQRHPET